MLGRQDVFESVRTRSEIPLRLLRHRSRELIALLGDVGRMVVENQTNRAVVGIVLVQVFESFPQPWAAPFLSPRGPAPSWRTCFARPNLQAGLRRIRGATTAAWCVGPEPMAERPIFWHYLLWFRLAARQSSP